MNNIRRLPIFRPCQQVELLEPPFGKYEVEAVEPPDERGKQVLFISNNVGGTLCSNEHVRLVDNQY